MLATRSARPSSVRATPLAAWAALALAVLWIGGLGSLVALALAIAGLRRGGAGRPVYTAALVVALIGVAATVLAISLLGGASSAEGGLSA